MTRRGRLLAAAVVIATAAGWLGWRSAQGPAAGGRTVAAWLRVSADSGGSLVPDPVVTSLGSRALPVLVRRVEAAEAPLRRRLLAAAERLPFSARLLPPARRGELEVEAAVEWLGRLGPGAVGAAPALERLLSPSHPSALRRDAAEALGAMGAAALRSKPLLESCLHGDDETVIAAARRALASIETDARHPDPAR